MNIIEIKKANFYPKKIKLNKSDEHRSIYIEYTGELPSKNEVNNINAKEDITFEPSKDLKELFNDLKAQMMQYFKFDVLRTVVSNDKFKPTSEQVKYSEAAYQEISNLIRVNTIHLYKWNNEETRNVKISVVFTDETGQGVSMTTGFIYLSQNTYGFESVLEDTIKLLIDEIYEYRFNGKISQLEIPNFKNPGIKEPEKKAQKKAEEVN
jgi:hypothetical protein